jgi:ATP-dependent Clp protease ATP-binding subunit ClpA
VAADTSETDMKFSNNVEASLHRALTIAQQNFQDPATIEHLLLSLTEDPDALAVLKACAVNIDDLRSDLFEYLSKKPKITVENGADVKPDLQFQRVIERAIFHVKASGLKVVNSSNVLVAMFAERESLAVGFLGKQDVTRYDVVNFVAHGIKKISRTFVSEISTSGQIPKNDPLKKYVFLSYSRSDARIARIIRQELIRQGISIWWDQDIVSGSRWRHEISANLQSASVGWFCGLLRL